MFDISHLLTDNISVASKVSAMDKENMPWTEYLEPSRKRAVNPQSDVRRSSSGESSICSRSALILQQGYICGVQNNSICLIALSGRPHRYLTSMEAMVCSSNLFSAHFSKLLHLWLEENKITRPQLVEKSDIQYKIAVEQEQLTSLRQP